MNFTNWLKTHENTEKHLESTEGNGAKLILELSAKRCGTGFETEVMTIFNYLIVILCGQKGCLLGLEKKKAKCWKTI